MPSAGVGAGTREGGPPGAEPVQDSAGSLAVEIRDLEFEYRAREPVLDVPRFDVSTHERLFVYGPSGSGKTTLLGIIAGVLAPRRGRATVLGRDLNGMDAAARDRFRGTHVGYMFQMFNLLPYLDVETNILLPVRLCRERRLRLNGVPPREAAAEVAEALGIGELLRRQASELSVGQQQRVAAARALLASPELVIADEPTSALDAHLRHRFLELLFARCEASSSTLVFVSHDRQLESLFDRALDLGELNRASSWEASR